MKIDTMAVGKKGVAMSQAMNCTRCACGNELPLSRSKQQSFLVGLLVYPLGDLSAQLILGQVDLLRLLIVALVGATLYRFEVPRWFAWLDRIAISQSTVVRFPVLRRLVARPAQADSGMPLNWLGRTLLAMAYFNPLWIARHIFFIRLPGNLLHFSLGAALLAAIAAGAKSFLVNAPFAVLGNYIVQNHITRKWRFLGN